jgi:hypothetical protein
VRTAQADGVRLVCEDIGSPEPPQLIHRSNFATGLPLAAALAREASRLRLLRYHQRGYDPGAIEAPGWPTPTRSSRSHRMYWAPIDATSDDATAVLRADRREVLFDSRCGPGNRRQLRGMLSARLAVRTVTSSGPTASLSLKSG